MSNIRQKHSTIESHVKPSWLQEEFNFNIWPISDANPYVCNQKAHTIQFYELIWIFEGIGDRIIDGVAHTIKPNRIFFMRPLSVHRWREASQLKGFFILMAEEMLIQIAKKLPSRQLPFFSHVHHIPYIDITPESTSYHLLQLIQAEYDKDSPHRMAKITSLFHVMFLDFIENSHFLDDNNEKTLSSKFEELLECYPQIKKVDDFAKKLNFSPNYFNDKIKGETGQSAGWWIRHRTVREAKKRLLYSQKSVKEIAAEMDFDDVSYFCRFFKKQTSLTPKQFRKTTHL